MWLPCRVESAIIDVMQHWVVIVLVCVTMTTDRVLKTILCDQLQNRDVKPVTFTATRLKIKLVANFVIQSINRLIYQLLNRIIK